MEPEKLLTCHHCPRYALAELNDEQLCLKCLLERIEDSEDPALQDKIRPLHREPIGDEDPSDPEKRVSP